MNEKKTNRTKCVSTLFLPNQRNLTYSQTHQTHITSNTIIFLKTEEIALFLVISN